MPLEEEISSEVPSWNEVFYGKAVADAMEKFSKCLLQVENRHQAYFDALTEEAEEKDKPVRLHNFTIIQWDSTGLQLGVKSELRDDIAEECKACVNALS